MQNAFDRIRALGRQGLSRMRNVPVAPAGVALHNMLKSPIAFSAPGTCLPAEASLLQPPEKRGSDRPDGVTHT
jgi:hypothetical protein